MTIFLVPCPRGALHGRHEVGRIAGAGSEIRPWLMRWDGAGLIPGLGLVRRLRAGFRTTCTRAAPGLRPGSLGTPARSWLTKVRSLSERKPNRPTKARPGAGRRTPPVERRRACAFFQKKRRAVVARPWLKTTKRPLGAPLPSFLGGRLPPCPLFSGSTKEDDGAPTPQNQGRRSYGLLGNGIRREAARVFFPLP
jgi:hypothetical protein